MKGITFKAGREKYTLRFSFNALCLLEDETGKGMSELFEGDMKLGTVRTTVWAGLQDEHPDLEPKDVGDLIDKVGIDVVKDKLAEALQAAFPDAEGAEGNVPASELKSVS